MSGGRASRSGAAWLAAAALVLAGCARPTGLVVHLESDITGGFASLGSTRLTLRYGDSMAPIVDEISYDTPGDLAHPIPGNIPIYAFDPEEMRSLDVLIESGLGSDGRPRLGGAPISEHFVVRLRPHHMLELDVHLDAECVNRVCPPFATCGPGGVCVPSEQDPCDYGSTTCVDDVMALDVPFTQADAGFDAAFDAPTDDPAANDVAVEVASPDSSDGALDTGMDATLDARTDVAMDASIDASLDAPHDTGGATDAATDAATDVPQADCLFMAVSCNAMCVTLGSNHDNCGSCGHQCATVESCTGGTCLPLSCPGGDVHCPGDMPGLCATVATMLGSCALSCGAAATSCVGGTYTCQEAHTNQYACCRTNPGTCSAGEFTIGALCCNGQ